MDVLKESYGKVLLAKMKQCPMCPWKGVKKQTVLPEGNIHSEIVIIGRNPGYQEDKVGRPFIGPGGKALDIFLTHAGIGREKIWITNTAKCQGGQGDPQPSAEVYETCKPWLMAELCLIRPKLIITLGADAYYHLTGNQGSILGIEGHVVPIGRTDTTVFVMSHPGWWTRQQNYFKNKILGEIAPKLKKVIEELGITSCQLDEGLFQLTEKKNEVESET
jgi:uracil-DNA glycosylase